MKRTAAFPDLALAGAIALIALIAWPAATSAAPQEAAAPASAEARMPAAVMTVQIREAPLLRRQRLIGGGVLLVLREGDLVEVIDPKQAARVVASAKDKPTRLPVDARPEFAWYHVSPHFTGPGGTPAASGHPSGAGRVSGYMHHSALLRGNVDLRAMPGTPIGASASEIALGGRGFDEIVESEYRRSHPGLATAFAVLDGLEGEPSFNPSLSEVSDFVAQTAGIGADG